MFRILETIYYLCIDKGTVHEEQAKSFVYGRRS